MSYNKKLIYFWISADGAAHIQPVPPVPHVQPVFLSPALWWMCFSPMFSPLSAQQALAQIGQICIGRCTQTPESRLRHAVFSNDSLHTILLWGSQKFHHFVHSDWEETLEGCQMYELCTVSQSGSLYDKLQSLAHFIKQIKEVIIWAKSKWLYWKKLFRSHKNFSFLMHFW